MMFIAMGVPFALSVAAAQVAVRRRLGFFDWRNPPTPPSSIVGLPDVSNHGCTTCHQTIRDEWRDSLHHHAFTNSVFAAAYRRESEPSCRNCHAPYNQDQTNQAAYEEGVSCRVCHVRDGHIVGAGRHRAGPPTSDLSASPAHPVIRRASLTDSSFCAGCHQFEFPRDGHLVTAPQVPNALMQSTYTEWLSTSFAQTGTHCQNCHMPDIQNVDGSTHREHRFVGASAQTLRSLFRLEATRDGRDLEVTITAAEIGHAIPTGDPFRRIELEVRTVEGALLWREVFNRVLGLAQARRPTTDEPSLGAEHPATAFRVPIADRRFGSPEVGNVWTANHPVPAEAVVLRLLYVRAGYPGEPPTPLNTTLIAEGIVCEQHP